MKVYVVLVDSDTWQHRASGGSCSYATRTGAHSQEKYRMYPVLSVLRRAAVSYVYVTPALLVEEDGQLCVRLEKRSHRLHLDTQVWSERTTDLVPVVELVVESDTSEGAAVSLAKKENDIAAAIKAEDALYTLVMGPEVEQRTGDRFVRRFRCAVVEGVYRASSTQRLAPEPAKNVTKARFGGGPSRRGVRLD
jgi:hypothetical protein